MRAYPTVENKAERRPQKSDCVYGDAIKPLAWFPRGAGV